MTIQAPRPLYHLLIAVITQFVLASAAILLLLAADLQAKLPWNMMGFLLAYNVAVATLVAIVLTHRNEQNKSAVVKGAGLVLGHLVGMIVGAFAGMQYAGLAGALAGGALLYFLAGWVGSRISMTVADQLDRQSTPPMKRDLITALRMSRRNDSLLTYGAVVPAMFLLAAVLLKNSGLPTAQYADILPTARLVLVIISLCSMLLPWLRRAQMNQQQTHAVVRRSAFALVGLGLSLAPAMYGFLLFVGFGLSISQLSLFALTASIAATTWGASGARA